MYHGVLDKVRSGFLHENIYVYDYYRNVCVSEEEIGGRAFVCADCGKITISVRFLKIGLRVRCVCRHIHA